MFENFFPDIQRLVISSKCCENCRVSILKEELVLGDGNADPQRELFNVTDLTFTRAIEKSKAIESAEIHDKELLGEMVSRRICVERKNFRYAAKLRIERKSEK